jgi:hypothetical protein
MSSSKARKATLRDALVARLGNPDRRRLHELASAVEKRLGPMSRADTYAVLADEAGIRLNKFLVEPDLGRVRGIIASGGTRLPAAPAGNGRRPRAKADTRLKEIVIDGAALVMDDPILPAQVAADAKRMAGVYPLTYVFENSVRELVLRVMEKKHGADWWKQPLVPRKVLDHAEGNRAGEKAVPWHGARGSHPIHYTSIDDLLAIITTNDNRPLFEPIIGKENGVRHLVEIIELSRHTIAHHRPLGAADVARLKLNVAAWQQQLRDHKHLI